VRGGELQKVEIPGTGDSLCTALHAQFVAQVVDMPFDRIHAYDEGDLPGEGRKWEKSDPLVRFLVK
jgi:hypothetical protein